MEQAQDYSFNKSHAACYALIAYRTAYLKAHHPAEYMAALISSVMNTKDRVPFYVAACDEMGIEVLPPDVNYSQADFAVVEGKIRFGLNAVKNVGESAARAIVAARAEGGPFESVWDFAERVDPPAREQARARGARQVRRARLDRGDAARAARPGRDARPRRRLGREAAGRHDLRARARSSTSAVGEEAERPQRHHPTLPSDEYGQAGAAPAREGEPRRSTSPSIRSTGCGASCCRREDGLPVADLERRRDGEVVTVGGIVGALKQMTTKKGDPMVFLRLDDLSGSVETVVFNSVLAVARELLELDRILVVKGRVDHKQEGETKLIALEVAPFEAAAEQTEREVRLRWTRARAQAGLIRELADVTRRYPGEASVVVALETVGRGRQTLRVRRRTTACSPRPDFYAEVKALLGEAAIV